LRSYDPVVSTTHPNNFCVGADAIHPINDSIPVNRPM